MHEILQPVWLAELRLGARWWRKNQRRLRTIALRKCIRSTIPSDRQKQAAILKILTRDWNPSGLREDRAILEYECYVAEVYPRLLAGVDASDIEKYLLDAEKARTDMDGRPVPGRIAIVASAATKLAGLPHLTEGACRSEEFHRKTSG
jgi:hypothetical protein